MKTSSAGRAPATTVGPRDVRAFAAPVRIGMTLVELMVVIVIISILSSLSLAGLAVARTTAKKSKTATTIRKISEIILPYYEQYETRRPTIGNSTAVATLANGRTYLVDAKQTAIRRLMALELPERESDYRSTFSGNTTTYPLTYSNVTATLSDVPPAARRYNQLTAGVQPTSSELLHLIVTRGPVADPDVIAHFREDEVRDTNSNGLPEFVDGWNRPIAFRRWPTGFVSPMQPIDGTVRSVDTLVSSNGHRLVPLIFSAGPDGAYDIVNEPTGSRVSYYDLSFDPFNVAATPASSGPLKVAVQSPTIAGSVILVSATLSSGAVTGPVVFTATRLSASSSVPQGAFQTIGSERDTGSAENEGSPNGILESLDNIHNHDMTR